MVALGGWDNVAQTIEDLVGGCYGDTPSPVVRAWPGGGRGWRVEA